VPCDREFEQFARRTCEAVCEETSVTAAVLALCESAGDRIQLIGGHEPSGYDIGAGLLQGEGTQIAFTAVRTRAFAESPGHTLVAAAADAGPFTLVLVCECDEYLWLRGGCVRDALGTAARIAGHAVCDRLRLEETERRRRSQQHNKLMTMIHSDVVQRMFGASLVLDGTGDLEEDVRGMCLREIERALTDLRSIIRASPDELGEPGDDLCLMLRNLAAEGVSLDVNPDALSIAPEQEQIACSILAEGMRNARKHALPDHVRVSARGEAGTLKLSVTNDGVRGGHRELTHRPGVGLQLAATEAALGGGTLESGAEGPDEWALRLTLPQEERYEYESCIRSAGGTGG
jgi:two-component system sensor histidine kinase DesK